MEKSALTIAGEQIEQLPAELAEIWKMVGRQEAFGVIASRSSAAWAESLKRLKEGKAYRFFNMTWEEFCPRHLNISRDTADRTIRDYKEFGEVYFSLCEVARISRDTFRAIEGSVTGDGQLDLDGELVPITKANSDRIREYLDSIQTELAQTKQEADSRRIKLDKAEASARNAREEAEALKKPKFVVDDGHHEQMLRIEADGFRPMMGQLRQLIKGDLSRDNQGRLTGLLAARCSELGQLRMQFLDATMSEDLLDGTQFEGARSPLAEHLQAEGAKATKRGAK
jgi:hypothetical protein